MNKKTILRSTLLAALLVSASMATAHEIKNITGFKTPESVITGKDGRVYVSEIGEFNKDGDGQISVIDADGKVSVFASGMDDPKGLAFIGKDLYVADKVRILKITPDGKWTVLAAKEAFPETPQFLNDLVADKKGNLYVSDSGDMTTGGAIYKVDSAGKVKLITSTKQDDRIQAPNGLLLEGKDHLLEVDFATGELYRVNIASGALTKIAEGFGGGDGLVRAKDGQLYISDFKGGKVYKADWQGHVELIKEGYQQSADIVLSADGKSLIVPEMKTGTVIWLHLH
ncbi:MAG: SMP-30/gluconolactonase/LRE family protein [Methylophilaceae bacterium]